MSLLTLDGVMERLGVARTTVYRLMEDEGFPRPLKVGRANRWKADEIEAWLECQAEARELSRQRPMNSRNSGPTIARRPRPQRKREPRCGHQKSTTMASTIGLMP